MATRGNIDLKINLIGNASTKFKKMNDNARKFKFMTREIIGDFHKLNTEFQTTNLRLSSAVRKLREFKRESDRTYDTRKVRQYNREVNKSGRSRGTSGFGMMSGLPIGRLGMIGLAAGGLAGAGRLTGRAITAAASRQRSQVELDQMFKGKGGGMITQLDALADKTPLQNRDLYKGAKTLGAFGFKANQVTPMLKMAGDLAMGDAQKLATVTNVLGRTKGLGKLTGELKNMLLETAQVDILGLIAKDTGRSVKELTEAMSKGKVSFEMVESAMQKATEEGGKYHNMMKKTSETYEGKMSTLQGKWNTLMSDLGDKILPVATKALDGLIKSLDKLKNQDLKELQETPLGSRITAIQNMQGVSAEKRQSLYDRLIANPVYSPDYDKLEKAFEQTPEGKKLMKIRNRVTAAEITLQREIKQLGITTPEHPLVSAENAKKIKELEGELKFLYLTDEYTKYGQDDAFKKIKAREIRKWGAGNSNIKTEGEKTITPQPTPTETPNIDESKDIDAATSGGARIKSVKIEIGEVKAADRIDVNGMDEVLDTVERDALTAMLNATGFAGNLGT